MPCVMKWGNSCPGMPGIASRLGQFSESVIDEMTRLAEQYGAINLARLYFAKSDETLLGVGERLQRLGRDTCAI